MENTCSNQSSIKVLKREDVFDDSKHQKYKNCCENCACEDYTILFPYQSHESLGGFSSTCEKQSDMNRQQSKANENHFDDDYCENQHTIPP